MTFFAPSKKVTKERGIPGSPPLLVPSRGIPALLGGEQGPQRRRRLSATTGHTAPPANLTNDRSVRLTAAKNSLASCHWRKRAVGRRGRKAATTRRRGVRAAAATHTGAAGGSVSGGLILERGPVLARADGRARLAVVPACALRKIGRSKGRNSAENSAACMNCHAIDDAPRGAYSAVEEGKWRLKFLYARWT